MAAYGLIPENITHVITPVRTALMNRINNTLGCNFVLEPDHCTEKQGLNNKISTANFKGLYYGKQDLPCFSEISMYYLQMYKMFTYCRQWKKIIYWNAKMGHWETVTVLTSTTKAY